MGPTSQPEGSTLIATAKAFMRVFTTLEPNTISAIQTETYKHVFAPVSLNPPGPFTRDGFASHLVRMQGIMSSFPIHYNEIWPNPSLRQVVLWTSAEPQFHDHVKNNGDNEEWKLKNEYMWVLTMDETGQKVDHVLEFLDSKTTEILRGLMARAFKKNGEKETTMDDRASDRW